MKSDSGIKIGCAFFNKPNSIQSGGWASLAGEEPFKFTTLDSLKVAGPLWVTSTPEKSFLTENGAAHPFLRHAGFLPTPITAIAEELVPYTRTQASLATAAQRVSEVLARVLSMTDGFAQVSGLILSSQPGARTLTSALQLLVAPTLRTDPTPPELIVAMPSLFAPPQPLGTANSSDCAVRIPANRLALTESVLASGVPGNTWAEVSTKEYPNALSWAVGDNKPVIAKVSIKGPLPKVRVNAPLMAHLTRGMVRWMCLPEIIALSRIVEMRAERVYVADEFVPTVASVKIPPPCFAPAAVASISAGLLAEVYMHAVCSPSTVVEENPVGNSPVTQTHPVRAAWLLAIARALMAQEAITLSSAGFSIVGYGSSHILVSVAPRNLRNLRKAIGASKLLSYPAGLRSREVKFTAPMESHEVAGGIGRY